MKAVIKTSLIAAAVATAPLTALANHCPSGMKYKKHGYYGHAYHPYYHPMPRAHYHPHPPKMYLRDDKTAGTGGKPSRLPVDKSDAQVSGNIIDTAIDAGNFSILIEALRTADLVKTLEDAGPFTVFAPSDEAFAKVPEKIRAAISADKEALAELLSYHVVPGAVTAADVARLDSATTVQGSDISIDASNGVKVDGASVVTADIRASNGIIHVIDSVLIPN